MAHCKTLSISAARKTTVLRPLYHYNDHIEGCSHTTADQDLNQRAAYPAARKPEHSSFMHNGDDGDRLADQQRYELIVHEVCVDHSDTERILCSLDTC